MDPPGPRRKHHSRLNQRHLRGHLPVSPNRRRLGFQPRQDLLPRRRPLVLLNGLLRFHRHRPLLTTTPVLLETRRLPQRENPRLMPLRTRTLRSCRLHHSHHHVEQAAEHQRHNGLYANPRLVHRRSHHGSRLRMPTLLETADEEAHARQVLHPQNRHPQDSKVDISAKTPEAAVPNACVAVQLRQRPLAWKR